MAYLDRIREANVCDPSVFRPFLIDHNRVGFIASDFATTLKRWPAVFEVNPNAVTLVPGLVAAGVAERTDAVAAVLELLRAENTFSGHWWDERYAVNRAFHERPVMLLERAALQHFGVVGYGVHLNGYVRTATGLAMWVGRRARDKPSGAGKLDQVVAGGQPAAIGLKENMIKECAEEAAMPRELAERMTATGVVTYCLQAANGLRPDVLFTYDLELPADFQPVNTDGEVEAFYLWPIERVMAEVRDGTGFKFNCALVVIDFLIRHGLIEPEHPDYVQLVSGLRNREPVLARWPSLQQHNPRND